jgi:PPK2 family polyphosphate:nucleotide phosphotransferase
LISLDRYRVEPETQCSLEQHETDPSDQSIDDREKQFEEDVSRLADLHDRLGAAKQDALLIILLAFDTGGKDPTINRVFNRLPVQSLQVEKFAEPEAEEQSHDFLWRTHIEAPKRGEIVVFNRSYYDDVVEPRLMGDLSLDQCRKRYKHILNFEALLHEENATQILKFYLHISRSEQRRRVRERLENPIKQWDFDPHDIETQERWDEYSLAYEDVISATSSRIAPWYIVPADSESIRDAIVARVVTDALSSIDPKYPDPPDDLERWKRRLEAVELSVSSSNGKN